MSIFYKNDFVKKIEEDSPEWIDNISREHACIIIQEIIRASVNYVYIQCSKLASDIYGTTETKDLIVDAMNRGVKIRIAVRSSVPEARDCYDILNLKGGAEVHLLCKCSNNDFCISDNKRFRYETDAENRHAKVCANDPEMVENLKCIFDAGFGKCSV